MKLLNSAIFAFIILFALQNANARDTIYFESRGGQKDRSIALWQGQIKENHDRKEGHPVKYIAQIDSVLLGNMFNVRKFAMPNGTYELCSLKQNANYIALSGVSRTNGNYICPVVCENILPYTPENRQKLIKKFKETTVIYKYPIPELPVAEKTPPKGDPSYCATTQSGAQTLLAIHQARCVSWGGSFEGFVVKGEHDGDYCVVGMCEGEKDEEEENECSEKCQIWGKAENNKPRPKEQSCAVKRE